MRQLYYRLYRAEIIRKLQQLYGPAIITHHGFECMMGLLVKMVRLEMKISEVPMVLDTSQRLGKSKMNIFKTSMGYFSLLKDLRKWQNLSELCEDLPVRTSTEFNR